MTSKIGWTDETWNIVTGCNKVSPGCRNCYALHMSHRLGHNPKAGEKYKGTTEKTGREPQWTGHVQTHNEELIVPLSLQKPRRIFVCSMSDLFHPDVKVEFIAKVFAVMSGCPQHQFQVLTKRPERMKKLINDDGFCSYVKSTFNSKQLLGNIPMNTPFPGWPLPNVCLGTSVEDKERKFRIAHLRDTLAAVHFLSLEPLLDNMGHMYLKDIDWVIVGGESGKNARLMHPAWVKSIRDQCERKGIPFFFKQWGEYAYYHGLPIPLDHAAKIKYYWQFGKFNRVKPDDPASVLKQYPIACKVGKHEAGNLLDGQKHEEFPDTHNLIPET